MEDTCSINCCITPNKLIVLQTKIDRHGPIKTIDRMNPDSPQKTFETPGSKCNSVGRLFYCALSHYNNLMVILERNWLVNGIDPRIFISFWDLRDEPCLFKEEQFDDMFPAEIWCNQELGEGDTIFEKMDIHIVRDIMAFNIVLSIAHEDTEDNTYRSSTSFYGVNTAEPSLYPDIFHLRKIVKHSEDPNWGACTVPLGGVLMNDKYFIRVLVNEHSLSCTGIDVSELETLLSAAVDTKTAVTKFIPIPNNEVVIEPGMSDRLAVFNTMEHSLTILDLSTTKPIIKVDTIQCSIIGQPSEDKNWKTLRITDFDGSWSCGSFLFLQKVELVNMKNEPKCNFQLSIVDPRTAKNRSAVVTTCIKDIRGARIPGSHGIPGIQSYIKADYFHIDLLGIVHVMSHYDGITFDCVHFDSSANRNATLAAWSEASEYSEKDNFATGLLFPST